MAHVFNRTTGQFLQSVNTPDFDVVDWVLNPDLTATVGQPVKYWFITGGTNPEGQEELGVVDAGSQIIIDAAIADARSASQKDSAKSSVDIERVVRALVDLLPSEFNILRTLHTLPDRTAAQVNAALKANIDAQP